MYRIRRKTFSVTNETTFYVGFLLILGLPIGCYNINNPIKILIQTRQSERSKIGKNRLRKMSFHL